MFENLVDAAVLKTVTVSVVLLGSDDLIVAAHSGVFQDGSTVVVEAFAVAAVVAGAVVVDVAAVVVKTVVIEAVFVEAIAVTAVDIVAVGVVVEAVVVEAVVVVAVVDVAAVVVVVAVADLFQSGRCYFEFLFRLLFRFCLNRFQIFRPLEQIRNLIVCRYCFFLARQKYLYCNFNFLNFFVTER